MRKLLCRLMIQPSVDTLLRAQLADAVENCENGHDPALTRAVQMTNTRNQMTSTKQMQGPHSLLTQRAHAKPPAQAHHSNVPHLLLGRNHLIRAALLRNGRTSSSSDELLNPGAEQTRSRILQQRQTTFSFLFKKLQGPPKTPRCLRFGNQIIF